MGLRSKLAQKRNAAAPAPKQAEEAPVEEEVIEAEVVEEVEVEAELEAELEETAPETAPKPVAKKAPAKKAPAPAPVAVREETAPAQTYETIPGMVGEFDSDDLNIPRISLVQQLGDLAQEFDYMSFVYDKRLQLADAGESVTVIVTGIRKYWQEVKDYDEEMPKTYDFLADAEKDGFRKGYTKDGCVAPAADINVLINIDDPEIADYSYGDLHFVLAKWSVKSSAYTGTAKNILTDAARGLSRRGLETVVWDLTSYERNEGRMRWAVPSLRNPKDLASEVDAGIVDWVRSLNVIGA